MEPRFQTERSTPGDLTVVTRSKDGEIVDTTTFTSREEGLRRTSRIRRITERTVGTTLIVSGGLGAIIGLVTLIPTLIAEIPSGFSLTPALLGEVTVTGLGAYAFSDGLSRIRHASISTAQNRYLQRMS